MKINTDNRPEILPNHVLLGLTLSKIFLLPNLEPKIKAAESQIQTDTNIIKIQLIPNSIFLILTMQSRKTPIQIAPNNVTPKFSIGFSLSRNNSNVRIKMDKIIIISNVKLCLLNKLHF